ncbi:hypothetical protein Tco_0964482, partial [Tanacetum coccineum]
VSSDHRFPKSKSHLLCTHQEARGCFSPQWRFLIHNILHCLSPKKTAWEQFSSNIAAAVICLATNRKFNFSRMIFEHMVSNNLLVPLSYSCTLVVELCEDVSSKQGRNLADVERAVRKHVIEVSTAGAMKEQERLSYAEAIRLEEQMNEEQRAQIARDEEIARQWDEEERQRATMKNWSKEKKSFLDKGTRRDTKDGGRAEKGRTQRIFRHHTKRRGLTVLYQVFRGDGSSKNYKILSEMLEDFDRLDVEELYRLVKEREEISFKPRDDLQDVEEET